MYVLYSTSSEAWTLGYLSNWPTSRYLSPADVRFAKPSNVVHVYTVMHIYARSSSPRRWCRMALVLTGVIKRSFFLLPHPIFGKRSKKKKKKGNPKRKYKPEAKESGGISRRDFIICALPPIYKLSHESSNLRKKIALTILRSLRAITFHIHPPSPPPSRLQARPFEHFPLLFPFFVCANLAPPS